MHNNEVSNGNASMEDVFHSAEKKGLFLSYKGVKYMDCLDNMKKSKMIRPNTTGGIMS